jgi:hypothetical protein
MDAPIGSLIAYSTSPGAAATDGSERNGILTQQPSLSLSYNLLHHFTSGIEGFSDLGG